jgi:hypothetical protein
LRRLRWAAARPQHGHRDKRPTIAAMSLRRMVAIEFGMCRSGCQVTLWRENSVTVNSTT